MNLRGRVIQKDKLFETINNAPNVKDVEWIHHKDEHYSRTLQFTVNKTIYRIVWWSNVSYLLTKDDLKIPFDYVIVSGTWPNRYKTNLQFYKDGEVVAILPIEKYKEEIKND